VKIQITNAITTCLLTKNLKTLKAIKVLIHRRFVCVTFIPISKIKNHQKRRVKEIALKNENKLVFSLWIYSEQ
jgi:hypothetical protein